MAMIIDKEKCCGCGSCGAVCPQGCITMQPDEEGFLYPQMDTQRCTSCQACRTVCPVLHMPQRLPIQGTYSAYSRDEAVRRESSSGGVFTESLQGGFLRMEAQCLALPLTGRFV